MPSGEKAAHDVHEHIDAKGAGAHTGSEPGAVPEHEDEHHSNARDLVRKEREAGERTSVSRYGLSEFQDGRKSSISSGKHSSVPPFDSLSLSLLCK